MLKKEYNMKKVWIFLTGCFMAMPLFGRNYDIIVHNKAGEKILFWPIPKKAPPQLLATLVPNSKASLNIPSDLSTMGIMNMRAAGEFEKNLKDAWTARSWLAKTSVKANKDIVSSTGLYFKAKQMKSGDNLVVYRRKRPPFGANLDLTKPPLNHLAVARMFHKY